MKCFTFWGAGKTLPPSFSNTKFLSNGQENAIYYITKIHGNTSKCISLFATSYLQYIYICFICLCYRHTCLQIFFTYLPLAFLQKNLKCLVEEKNAKSSFFRQFKFCTEPIILASFLICQLRQP